MKGALQFNQFISAGGESRGMTHKQASVRRMEADAALINVTAAEPFAAQITAGGRPTQGTASQCTEKALTNTA